MTTGQLLDGRRRARLVLIGFLVVFLVISGRVGQLTIGTPRSVDPPPVEVAFKIPRPEIVDRNGRTLATDITVASLWANPRAIIDIDEAIELLTAHLPRLDSDDLRRKLSRDRAFVWVERHISPAEQATIHDLGIPGVGFRQEIQRIYPMGRLAAHVVGFTDIDSRGLAGIERYLDESGQMLVAALVDPQRAYTEPVHLSIDVRAQNVLAEELQAAIEKFSAQGAAGVVVDVHTGEVIAMASLPDFNPNQPREALQPDRINKITGGTFEMGSTMKTVTLAMALDEGVTDLNGSYDARGPLMIGRQRIRDYRGKNRFLTVPEVFVYSSNIATARMAFDVGEERHRAFLGKLGFLERLRTEIPEAAAPLVPNRWSMVTRATVSFGHGLSIQPLQLAAAVAAFMNGGYLIPPTFLKRDLDVAKGLARRVISDKTSTDVRYLLRLNVERGTASRARIEGYRVGGKTGTAEKVIDGRYSNQERITSFVGGFPMDDPRYAILILLDDPRPIPETHGFATAGWNAVPTGGRVISRIAPIMGIMPKFELDEDKPKLEAQARN